MKRLLYILTLILSVMCYMFAYANTVSNCLSNNLLRFHIISNSNSDYDTQVKLYLRDFISEKLKHTHAEPYSSKYISEIEQLSNDWLEKNGISYKANASYKRCFINRKKYMDITLPQGYYNTIRLTLGEGAGENWWCVAYPSLCFNEAKSGKLSEQGKKILKEKLPDDCYQLITDEKQYRFFVVDFISGLTKR